SSFGIFSTDGSANVGNGRRASNALLFSEKLVVASAFEEVSDSLIGSSHISKSLAKRRNDTEEVFQLVDSSIDRSFGRIDVIEDRVGRSSSSGVVLEVFIRFGSSSPSQTDLDL